MNGDTSQARAAGDDATLRRPLLALAGVLAVAAALHLVDHVVRGELVDDHRLIPEWDHSGWPFQEEVTPLTPSLAIPLLFIAGIVLTLRGRLWARFWLGLAIVVGAVVVGVHFLPGGRTETLGVIYRTYDRAGWSPVFGALAVADVVVIVGGLVGLGALAVRMRQRSGRW